MSVLNAAHVVEFTARRAPDHVYVRAGQETMTYQEVDAEAGRFANVLAGLGVGRRDAVALLLPNGPRFVACQLGVHKLGAVPVPLHVTFPAPEVTRHLDDSRSVALVAGDVSAEAAARGFADAAGCAHLLLASGPGDGAPAVPAYDLVALQESAPADHATAPTESGDPALVLYTAGTTGHPKGVVLSHLAHYYISTFVGKEFWQLREDDVVLMVAPPAHIFGQTLLGATAAARATVSLLERFSPEEFLATIQDHRVTFFAGVPTLVDFMLRSPLVDQYDLSSLKRMMIGGAPLRPDVARAFRQKFETVALITGYGMTEGVPICWMDEALSRDAPTGSVGIPAYGTTVRTVDEKGHDVPPGKEGEVVVRGPQMFTEYLGQPEHTADAWRGGWFHTGDLGRLDDDGHLFLVDRLKDLIKRSGYAVSPSEVEEVLRAHPAVADCAVVGVPDETVGEEIKAVVVLRPGAEATSDELIAHCKTQLAAYKYPRKIELRQDLPRSPLGKVLRRALRDQPAAP